LPLFDISGGVQVAVGRSYGHWKGFYAYLEQDRTGKPYPPGIFNTPDVDLSDLITEDDRLTWGRGFLKSVRDTDQYPKAYYIVWIREEMSAEAVDDAVTTLDNLTMAGAADELSRIMAAECAACKLPCYQKNKRRTLVPDEHSRS
jgi:hypothetical protein